MTSVSSANGKLLQSGRGLRGSARTRNGRSRRRCCCWRRRAAPCRRPSRSAGRWRRSAAGCCRRRSRRRSRSLPAGVACALTRPSASSLTACWLVSEPTPMRSAAAGAKSWCRRGRATRRRRAAARVSAIADTAEVAGAGRGACVRASVRLSCDGRSGLGGWCSVVLRRWRRRSPDSQIRLGRSRITTSVVDQARATATGAGDDPDEAVGPALTGGDDPEGHRQEQRQVQRQEREAPWSLRMACSGSGTVAGRPDGGGKPFLARRRRRRPPSPGEGGERPVALRP